MKPYHTGCGMKPYNTGCGMMPYHTGCDMKPYHTGCGMKPSIIQSAVCQESIKNKVSFSDCIFNFAFSLVSTSFSL